MLSTEDLILADGQIKSSEGDGLPKHPQADQ